MPDLLVFVSTDCVESLKPHFEQIAFELRLATAQTIEDLKNDEMNVAAMLIPFVAGGNAPRLQILGIASHSPERERKLSSWKVALGEAWRNALHHPIYRHLQEIFPPGSVEVWPIMPKGDWGRISSYPEIK
jgi:hypothetical protein